MKKIRCMKLQHWVPLNYFQNNRLITNFPHHWSQKQMRLMSLMTASTSKAQSVRRYPSEWGRSSLKLCKYSQMFFQKINEKAFIYAAVGPRNDCRSKGYLEKAYDRNYSHNDWHNCYSTVSWDHSIPVKFFFDYSKVTSVRILNRSYRSG